MKETCVKCGMLANVDPGLHRERYGHSPEVVRYGKVFRFDWKRYIFVPKS